MNAIHIIECLVEDYGWDAVMDVLMEMAESDEGLDEVRELLDAAGYGNLWVVANQADNVVVLNDVGRIVARLGAFRGIRKDGSARGLIFPASLELRRPYRPHCRAAHLAPRLDQSPALPLYRWEQTGNIGPDRVTLASHDGGGLVPAGGRP